LFKKDLERAIRHARKVLGVAFDKYPVTCQAAIIDLVFNLGSLGGFPNFKHAIKGTGKFKGKSMSERWKAAAKESYRPDVKQPRNSEIKQWLLDGAKEAEKAVNP